jgi:glycosyltransferase involved in cell wall biosynthesis
MNGRSSVDILLIHQAFASLDEPGGTRHHELARHLQGLGHRFTIITGQGSYLTGDITTSGRGVNRQVDDAGVEIWRIPGYHAWHRSFFHRMLSFLGFMIRSLLEGMRSDHLDLVWGTSPPIFQAVSAAFLARWRRVPFILEVRDLWPYFAVASGVLRSRLLIGMSNWLERRLYRAADVVIVNSPGFIEHVSARGAKRVELVPNGVDCETFVDVEADGEIREQLGIRDAFLVLYAGAHGLSNDLITVLRAAAILQSKPEIHIVLVGAGKEKAKLVTQAQAWQLSSVHFLDPVPKECIPAVFAQADAGLAILMAIDAYKTTYPNKVFDYMAAGLPVLCAIDGVIRNVVEEGKAGIFVQPGNPEALAEAILRLAGDRVSARQMGTAGRRWVCAHYDRKILASNLLKIMESVLD